MFLIRILLLLASSLFSLITFSQLNETSPWVWMKGGKSSNAVASFGAQGVSSPTNTPGGRYGAASWQDLSGNLWIFGGYGVASDGVNRLNDLWKYDMASNQWTWMKGGKDRKSTRLNSSHSDLSRMPSSA